MSSQRPLAKRPHAHQSQSQPQDNNENCIIDWWYVVFPKTGPAALRGPLLLSNKSDFQRISQIFSVGADYEKFEHLQDAVARMVALTTPTTTKQHQPANYAQTSTASSSSSSSKKRKLPSPPSTVAQSSPKNSTTTANVEAASALQLLAFQQSQQHQVTPKQSKEQIQMEQFHKLFERNFARLVQFKEEFGDTDVPFHYGTYTATPTGKTLVISKINDRKYAGLGQWCSTIRTQLRVYQESKQASKLTSRQVAQLREINFCMESVRGRNSVWKETQYKKLVQFHQQHGHCNVPSDKKHQTLRAWVNSVCDAYQQQQQKGSSATTTTSTSGVLPLTDEQLAKLQQLNLDFEQDRANKQKTFDESATEWLAYKAAHDSEEPPYNHPLRRWVLHTRKKYADGSILKQEQIDRLTKWGFQWHSDRPTPVRKAGKPKTLDERVEELRQYKAKFGDCLVPQKYPSLGNWVSDQRTQYKNRLRGEKSSMTDERLAKLLEVGFVFEHQPNGPRFLKATGLGQELQTRTLLLAEQQQQQQKEEQQTSGGGVAMAAQDNNDDDDEQTNKEESQCEYGAKYIF